MTRAEFRQKRAERAKAMAAKYRAGLTLQEIGDEHGISRERVRQLLAEIGVSRFEGGISIRAAHAEEERAAKRRARYMEKYGMTPEEYFATPSKARVAYVHQRKNAEKRGIAWGFKFVDWWRIWEVSGKWPMRGRGQGYCMARKGDTGPYSPDNVYICTVGQNFSDSYLWKPYHQRKGRKHKHGINISAESRRTGIPVGTIYARLRSGWSIHSAISAPIRKNNTHLRRMGQPA